MWVNCKRYHVSIVEKGILLIIVPSISLRFTTWETKIGIMVAIKHLQSDLEATSKLLMEGSKYECEPRSESKAYDSYKFSSTSTTTKTSISTTTFEFFGEHDERIHGKDGHHHSRTYFYGLKLGKPKGTTSP